MVSESDTGKEKPVARERLKRVHKRVKYDNKFFVFPDDDKKKMIITTSNPGGTLKIGIKEALILIEVIRHQIQEWREN